MHVNTLHFFQSSIFRRDERTGPSAWKIAQRATTSINLTIPARRRNFFFSLKLCNFFQRVGYNWEAYTARRSFRRESSASSSCTEQPMFGIRNIWPSCPDEYACGEFIYLHFIGHFIHLIRPGFDSYLPIDFIFVRLFHLWICTPWSDFKRSNFRRFTKKV